MIRYIEVEVQSGDTLSHIANKYGLLWDEIYYDPANSAFRKRRPDPNVIIPGDVIRVNAPDAIESLCRENARLRAENLRLQRRGCSRCGS